MLLLVKPAFEELSLRQGWLADEATMSYNQKCGGAIDFPPEQWRAWYEKWVEDPKGRFYRYLFDTERGLCVGEAYWHFNDHFQCHICGILVAAACRGQGYGREGLTLLLEAAQEAGISLLRDNIAVDNGSVELFFQCGFTEAWRTDDYVMVEKRFKK